MQPLAILHVAFSARHVPHLVQLQELHSLGIRLVSPRAVAVPAVGMAGEHQRDKGELRHLLGIAVGVLRIGDELAAHACDRLLIEARLGEGDAEQIAGEVLVLGEEAQAAGEAVEKCADRGCGEMAGPDREA